MDDLARRPCISFRTGHRAGSTSRRSRHAAPAARGRGGGAHVADPRSWRSRRPTARRPAMRPRVSRITPYHELEAEMRPERASGRKRAQFAIAVRNRANAPVDVQLAGVDPDNAMRFAFQKPRFTVAPGRRNGSAIMVMPPKPALVGRPVHRRFEITSTVIGSETGALPKGASLTQKPWIPAWALLLLPLLAHRRDRRVPALAADVDRSRPDRAGGDRGRAGARRRGPHARQPDPEGERQGEAQHDPRPEPEARRGGRRRLGRRGR